MNIKSIKMQNTLPPNLNDVNQRYIQFISDDLEKSLQGVVGKPLNEHTIEFAKETASVVLADLFSSNMIDNFEVDGANDDIKVNFTPSELDENIEIILHLNR